MKGDVPVLGLTNHVRKQTSDVKALPHCLSAPFAKEDLNGFLMIEKATVPLSHQLNSLMNRTFEGHSQMIVTPS